MPHDLVFKAANAAHRLSLALTGGRLGWDIGGMPALELTTIGRKSGQKRTVMLTTPVQEGETIVVVGSKGGDERNPGWYYNVRENPDVEVSLRGGPKKAMRARVASAEERARLWPLVTAKYGGYASYQKGIAREIPLVLLEPEPGD